MSRKPGFKENADRIAIERWPSGTLGYGMHRSLRTHMDSPWSAVAYNAIDGAPDDAWGDVLRHLEDEAASEDGLTAEALFTVFQSWNWIDWAWRRRGEKAIGPCEKRTAMLLSCALSAATYADALELWRCLREAEA